MQIMSKSCKVSCTTQQGLAYVRCVSKAKPGWRREIPIYNKIENMGLIKFSEIGDSEEKMVKFLLHILLLLEVGPVRYFY